MGVVPGQQGTLSTRLCRMILLAHEPRHMGAPWSKNLNTMLLPVKKPLNHTNSEAQSISQQLMHSDVWKERGGD